MLVALAFVFVAASDCEQAFERSPTNDAARITQAVPGASAEAEGVLVALNEIVDPWPPDNPFVLPDPGNKFVAFHVTVQNVVDEEYSVSMFDFRLSDAADFVYDPITFGHDSPLPFIYLGSGQMTEGWVTFEVNQGNQLKLLKYDPNIFTTSDIEFHFGALARIEPSDSLLRGDDPQPDDSQGDEAVLRDTFIQGGLEADWPHDEAACIYDVLRSHYPLDVLKPFVEGTGDVEAFVDDAFVRYRPEIEACRQSP